ncbi:MAG: hypothetical protein LLG04_14025 [Parachlamydia sp.]|nr:hypothetical protein [Parachlamydia sp.]
MDSSARADAQGLQHGLQNQRILIHCSFEQGSGDVSACMKILDIYKKYMQTDQLAFCIENQHAASLESFQESLKGIRVIALKGGDEQEDRRVVDDFAPTKVVAFHTHGPLASYLNVNPPIPTINLGEYGDDSCHPTQFAQSHRFVQYTLGLQNVKNEYNGLGFLFSQKLIDYFQDKNNENPLYRLSAYLPRLSPPLSAAIAGQNEIRDFNSTHALYFGYANSSDSYNYQMLFIAAMILRNENKKDGKQNLVFCLPGRNLFNGATPEERFSPEFVRFMKDHGFNQIELNERNSSKNELFAKTTLSLTKDAKANPRKIVIVASPLTNPDFLEVMKASENEVLCTGDQSLSEALSAGKRLFYEKLSHKTNHINRLCDILQKSTQIEIRYPLYTSRRSFLEQAKEMTAIFDKIDVDSWKTFIHELHAHYSCEGRIVQLAGKIF